MADKTKLYRLLGFSLFCFGLLYCFSFLVDVGARHSNDEGFQKVNCIMTAHKDADVIAFGSSVGEKGFNSPFVSAKTGLTAYNASIDGTNFSQYKRLIQFYNSYSSKKNIVLFFESYFSFYQFKAISSIERFTAYMNDPVVYDGLHQIDPSLTWKMRHIPLFKNTVVDHTYYKAAVDGWKALLSHIPLSDSLQGFVPSHTVWQKDADSALHAMRPFKPEIDPAVIAEYVSTIDELQRHGKQVVIILPPIYKELYETKVDYSNLRQTLDSVADVTKCTFWDFSHTDLSNDKHNFYNGTHLNYDGSVQFCERLADSLNAKKMQLH